MTLNPVGYTTDTQTLRRYSQHTYTHVHVGESTSVRYGHAVYAPVVRDIPGVPNTYQQFTLTLCSLSQSMQSKTRMYVYNSNLTYEYTDMPTTLNPLLQTSLIHKVTAGKLKHEYHTDCA